MLMYLYRNYSPDIQFPVHQCARSTQNPRSIHDEEVNRIFHYLVGTQGKVLTVDPNIDMNLDCYVDADFSGIWKHEYHQDTVCVKSSIGYFMTLALGIKV